MVDKRLLFVVDVEGLRPAAVGSGGYGQAAVVGGFGAGLLVVDRQF